MNQNNQTIAELIGKISINNNLSIVNKVGEHAIYLVVSSSDNIADILLNIIAIGDKDNKFSVTYVLKKVEGGYESHFHGPVEQKNIDAYLDGIATTFIERFCK